MLSKAKLQRQRVIFPITIKACRTSKEITYLLLHQTMRHPHKVLVSTPSKWSQQPPKNGSQHNQNGSQHFFGVSTSPKNGSQHFFVLNMCTMVLNTTPKKEVQKKSLIEKMSKKKKSTGVTYRTPTLNKMLVRFTGRSTVTCVMWCCPQHDNTMTMLTLNTRTLRGT